MPTLLRNRWALTAVLGAGLLLAARGAAAGRAWQADIVQLGLEHEAPGTIGHGRLGWYAALNLGAFEERDWQVDPTVQLGLLIPTGDRRWRVGVGYHSGAVPIGEFYRVDEDYVALGLWLDP